MGGSHKTAHSRANRRSRRKTAYLGETAHLSVKLRIFLRETADPGPKPRILRESANFGLKLRISGYNYGFFHETVCFGLKLRILHKTARLGATLHSFVHLFFSLPGKGCVVLFVANCSLGISMTVKVAIYYLLFSLALSRILRSSKGGN